MSECPEAGCPASRPCPEHGPCQEDLDAFAHELADKIRRMVHKRCVNDTDGDGDCAACARNPEALCRQYTPEDEALLRAADLIDPTKEGDRG